MRLTRDEQMLALLYGDGTKAGLEKALMDMRKNLQIDEAESSDGHAEKPADR